MANIVQQINKHLCISIDPIFAACTTESPIIIGYIVSCDRNPNLRGFRRSETKEGWFERKVRDWRHAHFSASQIANPDYGEIRYATLRGLTPVPLQTLTLTVRYKHAVWDNGAESQKNWARVQYRWRFLGSPNDRWDVEVNEGRRRYKGTTVSNSAVPF